MNALGGLEAITDEANRIYEAATPAEKRVIIARDVIAAIKASRIVPKRGRYVHVPGDRMGDEALHALVEGKEAASLKDLLPTFPACQACAKGAIFLCTVVRQNQVNAGVLAPYGAANFSFGGHSLARALGGVFVPGQLSIIEAEFESGMIDPWDGDDNYDDDPAVYDPVMFADEDDVDHANYVGPEDRMLAIMENIVENAGEFIPAPVTK